MTFGNQLPNLKQPGRGKVGENKSYDILLMKQNDTLLPVKLCFLKETAKTLNLFQTQLLMVPFLVDCLENKESNQHHLVN